MRTSTIFAETHTSERTMSPTGLLLLLLYWIVSLVSILYVNWAVADVEAATHTNCCPMSDAKHWLMCLCVWLSNVWLTVNSIRLWIRQLAADVCILSTVLVSIFLHCSNCTKFGLILRKIINTVATRCQILRLKCIANSISAGALQPQCFPDSLAGFKGSYFKGREWREKGKERGKGERGGREEEMEANTAVAACLYNHWQTYQTPVTVITCFTSAALLSVLRSVKIIFYRAMHFSANARSWDRMSSVCLSVCDVSGLWSHRLEILETNCTDN